MFRAEGDEGGGIVLVECADDLVVVGYDLGAGVLGINRRDVLIVGVSCEGCRGFEYWAWGGDMEISIQVGGEDEGGV